MKNIRVIVVDDSALIRAMFEEILNSDPNIEVVATAEDPFDARVKIKEFNPDVITLDIEMPKMDGISFLKKIMALRPMPVIMASSLTQAGAQATIQALEEGAVDYIPKTSSTSFDSDRFASALIEKVKIAAVAKINTVRDVGMVADVIAAPAKGFNPNTLIAIGSSTGGVEALGKVIPLLPIESPPVVMVQHMPEKFTTSFAKRLDGKSAVKVNEVEDGMILRKGNAYLAPGSHHMEVITSANGLKCQLSQGELVSGHRPSVDKLFDSVAKLRGVNAIGVILTGMGKDGAKGMLKMKNTNAKTLGQDEKTCVVYGMPKAAFLKGGIDKEVSIEKMAREILNLCT